MSNLICGILEVFDVQANISLTDLCVFIDETDRHKVDRAVRSLTDNYVISINGNRKHRSYAYKGLREEILATKIKVVKEVVEVIKTPKMPGFDPCSPAKAQLRDCWHFVMASRLRGPVCRIDVEDWFDLTKDEATRLMINTAKRFSDTIGRTYVDISSDAEYRDCRLYIK